MKKCIFNTKKDCNYCGNCDVCDLNSDKKCDSCGICLELQGYDTKAIGITEVDKKNSTSDKNFEEVIKESRPLETTILEEQINGTAEETAEELFDDYAEEGTQEAVEEVKLEEFLEGYDPNEGFEEDPNLVYFDDVEGLSDIMNDPEMKDKILNENYPGLLKFRER